MDGSELVKPAVMQGGACHVRAGRAPPAAARVCVCMCVCGGGGVQLPGSSPRPVSFNQPDASLFNLLRVQVNELLKEEMKAIHALSIKRAWTPAQQAAETAKPAPA